MDVVILPNSPRPSRKALLAKKKASPAKPLAAPQPKKKRPMDSNPQEQFASAVELLRRLGKAPAISKQFDPDIRTNTRMVYTNGVTLWLLVLQRLGNGLSLEKVVSHVLAHDHDIFPDNKRVREATLSENSSGYYKAKKKLSLETIHAFSSSICDYLGRTSEPVFGNQRVFIIDGTTFTLEPTPQLKRAFPPAINQHGASVWPIAMLMVAHEMQSGCALLPQIDPMYGPQRSSEAEQARHIVRRLPKNSIVMADSGFGIFSVAYHATQAGHDILFRLTDSRCKSLCKRAKLIDEGPHHQSHTLIWQPSTKDRKSNPNLPVDADVEIAIHKVALDNGKFLYLATTLAIDATSAGELYSRRYDVEFDIRDIKVTMDAENILARSVSMVKKELMTSIVAYNLIVQFRRQAAKLAGINPRRLSFTGVSTSFRDRLLLQKPKSLSEWEKLYTLALISASNRKLPNRSKPRSYPRTAHPRRSKSTKFMKQQRKENAETKNAKQAAEKDEPPPTMAPK
jgi:hypothetical protein